ncbi:MAG: hypothetical protein AAGL23_01380 [Pseudomonadota bacterium]
MRSYNAARRLFSFLESTSWCLVVFGVITVGLMLFSQNQVSQWGMVAGIAVLGVGAFMAVVGLLGVAQAQIGRAGVDSAEYSQQMLQIARDQLEISRQSLSGNANGKTTFATNVETKSTKGIESASYEKPDAQPSAQSDPLHRMQYKGKSITIEDETYLYDGLSFETRDAVEAHIDALTAPKLPGVRKSETA